MQPRQPGPWRAITTVFMACSRYAALSKSRAQAVSKWRTTLPAEQAIAQAGRPAQ